MNSISIISLQNKAALCRAAFSVGKFRMKSRKVIGDLFLVTRFFAGKSQDAYVRRALGFAVIATTHPLVQLVTREADIPIL